LNIAKKWFKEISIIQRFFVVFAGKKQPNVEFVLAPQYINSCDFDIITKGRLQTNGIMTKEHY